MTGGREHSDVPPAGGPEGSTGAGPDAVNQRRLFVGTFLSPAQQDSFAHLKETRERLTHEWRRKIRLVRPAKLHMTWVFLGAVEQESVAEAAARLRLILGGRQPMDLIYNQAEFWPSPRKARQVVLTPSTVPDAVARLGGEIREGLADLSAKADGHHFRPHITIMRLEPPAASGDDGHRGRLALPEWLGLDRLMPLVHEMGDVCLIESHLGAGQDDYVVLERFTLPA